jgi:hypothetical protein
MLREQWLTLRSHDLTRCQEERLCVHRQWLDGIAHMVTLVLEDLKVPVRWSTSGNTADQWFKDRINEYLAAINTERKRHGATSERADKYLVQMRQLCRKVSPARAAC